MILPTGFTNEALNAGNTVYDMIQRGVLRAYGKGYDTNDLVITDDGTNTVVTTVSLSALSQVSFLPLLKPTMMVGTFQQLSLVAIMGLSAECC